MTPSRLLPLAAAVVVLGACGSDSPAADSAADASSAGDSSAGDSSAVTIRATDYSFLDVPQSVEAGTTLELENTSTKEAHEIVAVRLPDDEERPIAELAALPPEEIGPFMAEVRTVIIAGPESDGMAVVGDGTLDEPGRYALICVIPKGADPEEYLTKAATSDGPPDVDGGPPHIVEGMYAELTVTG